MSKLMVLAAVWAAVLMSLWAQGQHASADVRVAGCASRPRS